jgi:N-acetylglucosamine-6-sulfatase
MRSLAAVDESLGRVLETLEAENMLDSTVIIFAGDNGYFHGEHGGMWDKRAAYEPSIRIPLLMRYPPLTRAGNRCDAMVLNIDLAPTLLELAGLGVPGTIQGQSWLNVLKGRPGRQSFLYEYFEEVDRRYKRPTVLAVRTKRWKYVTYPLAYKLTDELYDMKNDPQELNNLISNDGCADVVEQMRREIERLQKESHFRFPG